MGNLGIALFTTVVTFFLNSAHAEVLFSVENVVSPNVFQSMVDGLNEAQMRPAEEMTLPFFISIFDENSKRTPFTIICTPGKPDANLEGCHVSILAKKGAPGEASIYFKKAMQGLVLGATLAKMTIILGSDPNVTEEWDHKHAGNPFSPGTDAELFCVSSGTRPSKQWACSLSASEVLK